MAIGVSGTAPSLTISLTDFAAEARKLLHPAPLLFHVTAETLANSLHSLAFGLAAPRGLQHYLHTHYGDKTFEHLYRVNVFDTLLLIPYFTVMIVLAFYGLHRYQLVYLYFKYRKNATKEPPDRFVELPRVTIQLPIFNEQFVIDRLIDACCRLEYPADKLQIQVLDDSTDETIQVASSIVERYHALGHPIVYMHRANRYGYKAGALDDGMKTATGEFVAIFDADFVPPEDWLMKVIHHFAEPNVGMVQTRWTHLNRDYSMLTQIEGILLDGHFVLEHGGRSRTGVFFNFNGTAGMWRRLAIEEAGGWQHDTLTEDTDLSYRAQIAGWRFKYLQDVECPAELPIEMTAFKTQQARWAKGLIQTSKKILPRVWASNQPWHTKVEAFYHLTANLSYPLMVLLSVLLMPAMIIRFYQGWFQMLIIDVPLFLASTFSISTFYLVSQRELYPRTWLKTFLFLPFLMSLGIGLTVTNTKAVLEALFGVQSSFKRTPKYRVERKGERSQASKYRKRLGIVPWIELLIGCYFAATIRYTFLNENYFTVPFLLLFVVGYWYTGLMSLFQGRFERFRLGGANTDESSPKPFPVGV
jgi:cellulose synthase/poly-beta-1,6-N-acetylglucosamine synthase-like glycosyltransferase